MNVLRVRDAFVEAGFTFDKAVAIVDALEADVLSEVATKTDLAAGLTDLRLELRRDVDAMLDKRVNALTLEIAKQFGDLKTEMHKALGDMHKSIGDVKGDLTWKIYLALGLNFFGMLAAIMVIAKLLAHA